MNWLLQFFLVRYREERDYTKCSRCGYSLQGLPIELHRRCSECGQHVIAGLGTHRLRFPDPRIVILNIAQLVLVGADSFLCFVPWKLYFVASSAPIRVGMEFQRRYFSTCALITMLGLAAGIVLLLASPAARRSPAPYFLSIMCVVLFMLSPVGLAH